MTGEPYVQGGVRYDPPQHPMSQTVAEAALPTLAGSTHAVAHAAMLEANLGLSRAEAQARTEAYLRNLDRIAADQARLRAARAAFYTDDEPPF